MHMEQLFQLSQPRNLFPSKRSFLKSAGSLKCTVRFSRISLFVPGMMTNAALSESTPRGKLGGYPKSRVFTNRGFVINSVVCDSISAVNRAKTGEVAPRLKSPKPRSNRGSPTSLGHYAGAKFSEPPAAAALPPPPPHWTIAGPERIDHASHQLKLLLNVQA